jgi:hypothetical protein
MGLVMVRAKRAMLSARSLVFRRMVYADFAEAEQSVVDIGYSSNTVLQVIVDYYQLHR